MQLAAPVLAVQMGHGAAHLCTPQFESWKEPERAVRNLAPGCRWGLGPTAQTAPGLCVIKVRGLFLCHRGDHAPVAVEPSRLFTIALRSA